MGISKLLVVDDAFTILSLLDNLFKKKYEVTKCRSVSEAKEKINQEIPDFIITDLNMPEVSGEDLVMYLKSNEKLVDIPIIVLSSTDSVNTKLKMLKMGIDDYVQKPFNLEELSLRTDNILKRYNTKLYPN